MKDSNRKKEIAFAFTQTIPVMLGYLFLGVAFGLLIHNAGYSVIWAFCSSVFIYAGSMQFVLVTLLTGGSSLIYSAVMTLFVNGRHFFYGLSFVDKFKKMGRRYPYMVFSLTDETYSVLCNLKVSDEMDEKKVMFLISLFDHFYWVAGSVLGALAGFVVGILFLIILGPDKFLLPSLLVVAAILIIFKPKEEEK